MTGMELHAKGIAGSDSLSMPCHDQSQGTSGSEVGLTKHTAVHAKLQVWHPTRQVHLQPACIHRDATSST